VLIFIIRRSLQSVVVLLVMSVLVFVGVYAVGTIDILINPQADQQDGSAPLRSVSTRRCRCNT
jgi:peptide/nickel transport system permease protein